MDNFKCLKNETVPTKASLSPSAQCVCPKKRIKGIAQSWGESWIMKGLSDNPEIDTLLRVQPKNPTEFRG